MAKDAPWPPCTTEPLRLDASAPELVPRTRRARLADPYEATICPEIAPVESIPLSSELSTAVAEAETAVGRFDERVGNRLGAFAVIGLRTEAATSSQIENLTAASSSIAVAEHAPPSAGPHSSNSELIASNVATLQAAMSGVGRIHVDEILGMQRALLGGSAPQLTGRFRSEPVWVGGDGYSPHGATHVAPHHERVPAAMADFIAFANRDDLGGLAHIAVAHAHFETIHPFPDGNGRTGRVIVQRMLRESGLTRNAVLPLSAGLLIDTARYFESLDRYRTGDIEAVVSAFVDAAFATVDNASRLAADLAEVRDGWSDLVSARSDSTVWPLLDYCVARPAITSMSVAESLGVSAVAAQNAIDQLSAVGILRQNSPARRNRIWLVADVLDAVDDFMIRARRG